MLLLVIAGVPGLSVRRESTVLLQFRDWAVHVHKMVSPFEFDRQPRQLETYKYVPAAWTIRKFIGNVFSRVQS